VGLESIRDHGLLLEVAVHHVLRNPCPAIPDDFSGMERTLLEL
jgi:hypothetical protein